jgi:hypothetical protein
VGGLAPGLSATLARRLGSDKHAAEFADRQKDKR